MSAPPARTGVAGTPTNAEAKTAFGQLWDYVVGRLGGDATAASATTDAEKLAARSALAVASKIEPIAAAVASGSLTLTLNATALEFRSSTLSSGAVNTRAVATALSLVVPSGATLGSTNAVLSRIMLLALDNAGTVELAVCNSALVLDESSLISTTVLNSSSDSASVAYSTTARTNLPFRIIGFVESTQATAGTWATAPSKVQGVGGEALPLADGAVTNAKIQSMDATKLTGDVAAARIMTALNSTGSAPLYACRAWVNFNGTLSGASMIRASGNVSSITDNGVGNYTANFTTAMPDLDYGLAGLCSGGTNGGSVMVGSADGVIGIKTTSASQFRTYVPGTGGGAYDPVFVSVSFFR